MLEKGNFPLKSPIYSMSQEELQALHKFLGKNLSKWFISASSLPVALPVLFVKKPNSDLCLYADCLKLKANTLKNQYPLPLILETLDWLASAKYYTKLDMIAAFNMLCITLGHRYVAAYYKRYGQYNSLVMTFGLCNGESLVQHYNNDTLLKYLHKFCSAHLDNIVVCSITVTKHHQHVGQVFNELKAVSL